MVQGRPRDQTEGLLDGQVKMSSIGYIFIWIPKSAGTSVVTALQRSDRMLDVKYRRYLDGFGGGNRGITLRHRKISYMVRGGYLDKAWVREAFKFAFVRNPWDRMVSLYHYWHVVPESRSGVQALVQPLGFKEVCQKLSGADLGRPRGCNLMSFNMALPQTTWLFERGRKQADFIGRFENIEEDFGKVCKAIGVKASLPRLNVSANRKGYREYYDDESREIIGRMYADDIRMFGYEF